MTIFSRIRFIAGVSFLGLLGAVAVCGAGDFPDAPSLQGFTGIINVPTANVQKEGTLAAWYTNQSDPHWNRSHQDNYFFSVGLFSFVELGGRLTDHDLSAQFKASTAPFIPKGSWLPSLAFGMQDFGGTAHHFRSSYVAATEEISRLRLSVGYGFGPDRLKGTFGGAEVKAFDWLYLLGEYDTKDMNAGVRVITPDLFGWPVNLQATVKSALNNHPGTVSFAAGLQFSMGKDYRRKAPSRQEAGPSAPAADVGLRPDKTSVETPVKKALGDRIESPGRTAYLIALRDKLVADGFINVRTGSDGNDLLVVEYENARYDHSELDGMGVALGIVVDSVPAEFKSVRLVLKIQDIRMLQATMPIKALKSFFTDVKTHDDLYEAAKITATVTEDPTVVYTDKLSFSSLPRARLVLTPALKTFVGTEVGVFDYLLSIRPNLFLDLWKGAVLNARWDIPVAWSKNFDDGEAFRGDRNDTQFQRLMLFQGVKPYPYVMASLGAGMIEKDAYGTLNELYWLSTEGNHRLGFRQAYAKNSDTHLTTTLYLGSYRYYHAPLDTYLTFTGGQFWDNDKGFRVDLKRFFGDTAFSVYYKDSETAGQKHHRIGGVQIAFPLTFRKGMKPYHLQIKGPDEWSYSQETVISSAGVPNTLGVSIGDTHEANGLQQAYYDRDRLTPSYVRTHLLRLREAYEKLHSPPTPPIKGGEF
ncbi:YjbH domain-containing protein [Geotalea uraniireducens]|uniref:YjbH domain-containing protein n=1 Tax=Geotalea uraniireducens TaxID=351604 RepID=UPI00059D3B1F|nr:YjbH domain-containing protein [Geotalea uraniireducens]